jgi:hypothetical protein
MVELAEEAQGRKPELQKAVTTLSRSQVQSSVAAEF